MAHANTLTYSKEQATFLTLFLHLSDLQKKLWQLLCWFGKKCLITKVRQDWLAQKLGCCRATVNSGIKKFRQLGWLGTKHVAYSSLEYFVDRDILILDTRDKSIFSKCADFQREDLTEHFTHNKVNSFSKGTLPVVEDFEKKVFEKRERAYTWNNRPIPAFLKIRALEPEDQQKLANQFSERELYEALKDAKNYHCNKGKIKNFAAFVTTCAKIHKSKRIK